MLSLDPNLVSLVCKHLGNNCCKRSTMLNILSASFDGVLHCDVLNNSLHNCIVLPSSMFQTAVDLFDREANVDACQRLLIFFVACCCERSYM